MTKKACRSLKISLNAERAPHKQSWRMKMSLPNLKGDEMSTFHSFNQKTSEPGLRKPRASRPGPRRLNAETARTHRVKGGSARGYEDASITPKLASFISHDLRHHLSGIYCNVESMSELNTSPAMREELFEEVRSTIHDMTDLLDALILYARSRDALYATPESLNRLVEHTVGMLRSHPDAKQVELVITEAAAIHAWIDRKLLGSAIYNLLLNACQAAKRGDRPARVEVALYENDGSIYIRVEDSGPEMPLSVRKTLFQPFARAEKTESAGLGLMIVESAAKRHGGAIYLDETNSGNTVFMMRLSKFALHAFSQMPPRASCLEEIN